MCADGHDAHYEDAVDECPLCGGEVDSEMVTVEACCNYAEEYCPECGWGLVLVSVE